MNKKVSYEIGNATDAGIVRKVNEDYYGTRETLNGEVVVVCDGMGGHAGGETASRIAVDSIISSLNDKVDPDPINALNEALLYANKVILNYAREHPELKGMGSTCVALLLKDDCFYYAHVGDSRIYLLTHNHLQQLTKDHSFVQSLVDAGAINAKDAENHPRKNEITNALGLERMQPPSLCQKPFKPQKGDIVLLCTDGLTGMVSDQKIQDVLCSESALYEKAKELVLLANRAGGIDNITLQLVKFTGSANTSVSESKGKKGSKRVLLFAGVIMILFLLGGLAVMASGGLSGNTIGQKITTWFRHGIALSSFQKTPPPANVINVLPTQTEDALRTALEQAGRGLDSLKAEMKQERHKSDSLQVVLQAVTNARDALLREKNNAVAHQPRSTPFIIGQPYGDGIIINIDPLGNHGLIVAKSDKRGHSTGQKEGLFTWSDAMALFKHENGGNNGWRLPTKDELKTLYSQKRKLSSLTLLNQCYWSSSQETARFASSTDFRNGTQFKDAKIRYNRVRAVRNF